MRTIRTCCSRRATTWSGAISTSNGPTRRCRSTPRPATSKEFNDSLILLKVGWQEGQLLRNLGHLRAAEAVLLKAQAGFMERGLMYEVALVCLDLAALYVKLKAIDELKQTVTATVP